MFQNVSELRNSEKSKDVVFVPCEEKGTKKGETTQSFWEIYHKNMSQKSYAYLGSFFQEKSTIDLDMEIWKVFFFNNLNLPALWFWSYFI